MFVSGLLPILDEDFFWNNEVSCRSCQICRNLEMHINERKQAQSNVGIAAFSQ